MLNKIIKASIYLAVFLVPLFFLPFTLEAFDFNKVYLLAFLTILGALAWLGKMVFQEKQIKIKFSLLDVCVLFFLITTLLGAFLSVDKHASFLGFYGRFWPSALGVLILTLFYFLVSNNVVLDKEESKDKKQATLSGILKAFLASSFLISFLGYLSVFNLLSKLASKFAFLPQILTLRTFNLLGGSLESLSLFLVCVSVLLISLLALRDKKGLLTNSKGMFLYLSLFLNLGLLMLINFSLAWISLLCSLILFLILAFWKRIFKDNVNRLSLSIFLVLIALVFLLFNPLKQLLPESFGLSDLPSEVILNQRASWNLALQGIKDKPVLGPGVSNFSYVYAKYKPLQILESDFWQLRFDRSGSTLAEIAATMGILGSLAYLLLIGIFTLTAYLIISTVKTSHISKTLSVEAASNQQEREERKVLILPFFATFASLIITQLFYYQNVTLALFFFLILGLGSVAFAGRKAKVFKFGDFPEVGLVFSILFWVVLTAVVFSFFTLGKYYAADLDYMQYLKDPDNKLGKLEAAARSNNNEMIYHLALADNYLTQFQLEAGEQEPDKTKITNLVALSVREAKAALAVSPNLVACYEMAGIVYSTIIPAADGAFDWAIKSFEGALALEPKNPAILTQMGILYLSSDDKEKAREYLEKASALKSDYVPSQIQLARLESEAGDEEATRERLENLVAKSQFSVEARFELGRLYFNQGAYSKAREQFEAAVILFPNHSNSLYSLGLTYEKLDMLDEALLAFEKALSLNPGSEIIQEQIDLINSNETTEETTE